VKTILTTTSASVVFTPGPTSLGKLNFSNYTATPFIFNRLMAVINLTRNTIIYAEGSQDTGVNSWNQNTRELTLLTDTSNHLNTDILQVIYDSPATSVMPTEEYFDPVNKQRVSMPQSLIDTDFEYSVQSTKWETLFQLNNRPTAFFEPINPINPAFISAINVTQNSRIVNIVPTDAASYNSIVAGISAGSILYVQDTLDNNANGWFQLSAHSIRPNNSNPVLSYVGKRPFASTTNILDYNRTLVFVGGFYGNSFIPLSGGSTFFNQGMGISANNTNTILFTTSGAHGLSVGNLIYVTGVQAQKASAPVPSMNTFYYTDPVNGAFTVSQVVNTQQFTVSSHDTVPATTFTYSPTATLYGRPGGFSIHRPYDGGVQITCGSSQPNVSIVRQTRRYFRYQSGKGIQFSTGSILKPAANIESIIASTTTGIATITAYTKFPHGFVPGGQVIVSGSSDSAFNGTFDVTGSTETSITYQSVAIPSSLQAPGFPIVVSPGNIYGLQTRLGMFDQQNGMFFENDGINTFVVRRNSTNQVTGTVNTVNGSGVITGNRTLFSQQLTPGDFVAIKGQSYRISSIESDTRMLIIPEYEGVTQANTILSKTIDLRIPQSQWNIDKLDGTGPSGYALDATRMQMFYMDYSWYGAGFIRYGVRGNNGNIVYCHKIINNNVNTEAYLRSGNLPARYEESTYSPTTILTQSLATTDTVANVKNASTFPLSGIIKITTPGIISTPDNKVLGRDYRPIEYLRYNGRTDTQLLRLKRAIPGGINSPQTFTYSDTAPVPVELMGTVTASASALWPSATALSHWGSSVIMDGRFDNDQNVFFSAGNNNLLFIPGGGDTSEYIILAIRLSPSVDSGRVGFLGQREIINRMQLNLRSMDVLSTGTFRINLYLNSRISNPGLNDNFVFSNVGGSSLAQLAQSPALADNADNIRRDHPKVVGGENVFSFLCDSASSGFTKTFVDLSGVRELGNSIMGGGYSNNLPLSSAPVVGMYPDGPDILYITARNLNTGANTSRITARISWTEAQA
jgi:hypothetical protein